MKILGIDPGYAIVGYGVISYGGGRYIPVDYGAVTTVAETPFPKRLQEIYNGLISVIIQNEPEALAIEKLYFNTNKTTGIGVAEARGVILLAAQMSNIPVYEYTPLQVKNAVTGFGGAKKPQVMEMTKRLLKLSEMPKPDDTADALAVAICHAHTSGTRLRTFINQSTKLKK